MICRLLLADHQYTASPSGTESIRQFFIIREDPGRSPGSLRTANGL
jgi:hypothetical protein